MKNTYPLFFHISLTIYLLCLIGNAAFSQQKTIRFQHLTTEEGLAQNMVDCILQDSQGFMWIGTWNGLCRYDGYKFEIFNSEGGSTTSLKNNFIYALREDQFGNIWIGTKEGLYLYIYNKNEFRFINTLLENASSLESSISAIAQSIDNTYWIGTDKGVVHMKVLDEEGKIEILEQYLLGDSPEELTGATVRAIRPTHSGIWVGTDAGINVIDLKGSNITKFHHDPADYQSISSDIVHSIYEDSTGKIWIGTEVGLNLYDQDQRAFIHYFHQPSNPKSLPHNSVTDIIEIGEGRIFLSTLGGLGEYLGNNNFRSFKSELKTEHSLNSDFINCLFADKMNNLWIGTERGGVNIYNTHQNVLEFFAYDKGNESSLTHNTINSIYEDEEYIWIGTAGGGLNRFDKSEKTYKPFRYAADNSRSLSSDFITAIHRDSRGQIWLATWGSGLNLMKEAEGKGGFINNRNSTRFNQLTNGFIAAMVEDSLGNLWIGTNGGLFRYNREHEQIQRVADEINAIGCLAFDEANNLWIGSPQGLYHLKFKNSSDLLDYTVTNYKHDPLDSTSLSGNYVISMVKDAAGNMWFGTYGQGLNKLSFTAEKPVFKIYNMQDGIANNIIYGIVEDNERKLWLSTDNGLTLFDPITGRTKNFYKADGLLNNQYYWSAHYKNASGKLYFGGMNGLNTFYPSWLDNRKTQPGVVITDLRVYNESVIPGAEYQGVTVLEKSISKTKSINLSYKSKAVAFEFSALDYNEPGLIKYAYYLKGLDEGWNFVNSNRRFANYTNLKPGDYTFYVKSSDLNGEFISSPIAIDIHIAPPFWDTWWFRIMVVTLVAALIIGYNRYRVYNLKTQKIILEKQVEERTEKINHQKHELFLKANQLKVINHQLEKKQLLIKGQNDKLELQNEHILHQRNKLIELNRKVKLVSQLKLSFFTNVSHEFRTPLTLIIGPLEGLLKRRGLDADIQNTLELINRNAQRLLHLINQIMDFRRVEKGRMELKVAEDDLNVFCKDIFKAFQPLAEIKKITFNYTEDVVPSSVWFDHQKIENIIYNLLSNAFKFTPEKGQISMEVKALAFAASKLQKGNWINNKEEGVISIKISDSGIGISKENLPLIFKRFYRIDSEAAFQISGSGIGLTLAEELAKTHHGGIFVESVPGVGSTFEIQFPCLKDAYHGHELLEKDPRTSTIHKQVQLLANDLEANHVHRKVREQAMAVDKSKAILLIVEDNKDLRQFLVQRFTESFNVREAENGKKAFQYAREINPDIIVSDVMMPEMDGYELCAKIKSDIATSHIPIILLTAKTDIQNRIKGLDKGADDYLAKPFNFDLLDARIRNLIESRKHLRKLFIKQSEVDERRLATSVRDQKFLEQAIRVVEDKMEDPSFGSKDFVKAMGMSRSLLHKKLTALTEQSATEFINHFRLKRALKLLNSTDMNISEIAYSVGYNDPKYFSRIFSKQYGEAPKEYLQSSLKRPSRETV